MFGKRVAPPKPNGALPPAAVAHAGAGRDERGGPEQLPADVRVKSAPSEAESRFAEMKVAVFGALLETVDLKELSKLTPENVRAELSDVISEIVAIKSFVINAQEQQRLVDETCNDILGLGPLEPLISRDDIADIMVNGADTVYIETDGKIVLTGIRFRDNAQLLNICQRIVSAVGRRVDEASPICDARLADGSRVNVIAPPLAIDGPTLTIRKFKKDKLTLEKLMQFGSVWSVLAEVLKIIGHCRVNVIVSGGSGSGNRA